MMQITQKKGPTLPSIKQTFISKQTREQLPIDTPSDSCCGCLYKPYSVSKTLLLFLAPLFAVMNIISDIFYLKSHEQNLKNTDLFGIYLFLFLATPIFAIALTIYIKVRMDKFNLRKSTIFLVYAWLELFIWQEQILKQNKTSSLGLIFLYFKSPINIVQFLIQFYVMAYTRNTLNVFLVSKSMCTICQIISRLINCYTHRFCDNIREKDSRLV